MSATSVFVMRDRVHLVTDGAGYNGDNRMLAVVQKVALAPHLGVAIAVRGHTQTARWIESFVMNLPDTDRLEEYLAAGLRDQFGDAIAEDPSLHFDALVAGMRDGKPFALLVSSHDRAEHKPFEALAVPAVWSSPPIEADAMGGVLKAIWNSSIRAARLLLEAQRDARDCPVGGYGQITTISAAGIETKLVCKWVE